MQCSHCPKACGTVVEATLRGVSHCMLPMRNIFNHDGKLVCEEALPLNDEGLPLGSYIFSCHGCSVEEGTLTCSACLDDVGKRHRTNIAVAGCCSFASVDGVLQCDEPGECNLEPVSIPSPKHPEL